MYACICARVRESELRAAIRTGARTEEAVAAACGAGTGCGGCRDRICDMLMNEKQALLPTAPVPAGVAG